MGQEAVSVQPVSFQRKQEKKAKKPTVDRAA
jgi:hypothetical protein